MSRKENELDIEQLMRLNRPASPPPPEGEYGRILAAAQAEAAAPAPAFFKYIPLAIAATFVIALATALFMDDGHPTDASRERDDRMEAFLSDTLGGVMAERTEQPLQEPFNVDEPLMENGGK